MEEREKKEARKRAAGLRVRRLEADASLRLLSAGQAVWRQVVKRSLASIPRLRDLV